MTRDVAFLSRGVQPPPPVTVYDFRDCPGGYWETSGDLADGDAFGGEPAHLSNVFPCELGHAVLFTAIIGLRPPPSVDLVSGVVGVISEPQVLHIDAPEVPRSVAARVQHEPVTGVAVPLDPSLPCRCASDVVDLHNWSGAIKPRGDDAFVSVRHGGLSNEVEMSLLPWCRCVAALAVTLNVLRAHAAPNMLSAARLPMFHHLASSLTAILVFAFHAALRPSVRQFTAVNTGRFTDCHKFSLGASCR